jgi:hypothetical protein
VVNGFLDASQEERVVGLVHCQNVQHTLEMLQLVLPILEMMEIVISQLEQPIAKLKYAPMPQLRQSQMQTVKLFKRDVSLQEKDVFKQLQSLCVQLMQEIFQVVLDI